MLKERYFDNFTPKFGFLLIMNNDLNYIILAV